MAFDLSTAKPESSGFDLSTARPLSDEEERALAVAEANAPIQYERSEYKEPNIVDAIAGNPVYLPH